MSPCDCMQKATQEICDLQLKDATLTPYFTLSNCYLPMNLNLGEFSWSVRSSKLLMECCITIIPLIIVCDHSLWCMMVPSDLRQTLLKEAHSSVFSGHFSERFTSDFVDSTGDAE